MRVYQDNGRTGQTEWLELGDRALAVLPKPNAKTQFRMGLANVFESKSAGVVEKVAASPEFLGVERESTTSGMTSILLPTRQPHQ